MRPNLAHLALVVLMSSSSLAACDDACIDLSEQICSCESTQSSQAACLQRLDQRAVDRTPTAEDLERCRGLQETCTCDALASGEYAACGLSAE